jgi:KUP system potassium uptake protein
MNRAIAMHRLRPVIDRAFPFAEAKDVLNYFGQGALILGDKAAIENPFFRMVPNWGLFPLVLLSTAATVIASQAVISGAFSLSRQAIQLGLMPPLDIFQTSTRERGQIYIPQVNWLLLIAVLALVLGFQSSSALASAYGFAVTGTMTITTVLAAAVMRGVWRWQWPTVVAVLVPIMTVDLALFASNALKIPSGGWFPLVIGIVVFTIMTTWRAGRRLVLARLASQAVPLPSFLATCEEAPEARVSGTAVFLTTQTENRGAPRRCPRSRWRQACHRGYPSVVSLAAPSLRRQCL